MGLFRKKKERKPLSKRLNRGFIVLVIACLAFLWLAGCSYPGSDAYRQQSGDEEPAPTITLEPTDEDSTSTEETAEDNETETLSNASDVLNIEPESGTAYLHANLSQDGALLLGRELERDGPARGAGGEAERSLTCERIDLDHHAVDVVVQLVTMREGIGAEIVHLARARHATRVRIDREPALPQPVKERALCQNRERFLVGHRIDERLEVAVGGDLGVLLTQRSRSGVSRIGEDLLSRGVTLLVEPNEAVLGHVDLAADLDGLVEATIGHAHP